MSASGHARQVDEEAADDLYDRIGRFLIDHGLSPDPAHYSFAYQILTDPGGSIAQAVDRLSDGRVRVTPRDIEKLGTSVATGEPTRAMRGNDDAAAGADKLVAQTQAQVEGFALMVRAMHDETRGFGRDLEQSAAAIVHRPGIEGIDEIARVTGAMIARIHDAEKRLARATDETDDLREKLAEAHLAARRDPLTGLPNRRAFEEAFAARDLSHGVWCLAVCDIDRFKRVNDEHGHAVGDRVLSVVGQTIADACGEHLVVRHGGEEFAVLIGPTSLAQAAALIDVARATVAAKRFRNRETDRSLGAVTMSVGITTVRAGETGEQAFVRADQLLYKAKTAGRNRVLAE
ncbi:diguanylate cyclase [Sphingomonas sp. Tas61C01]|uniref:diguanylate cyclase n=1 Tax=Sphingomonas sp. Tas61C01 TaxID=3458297 RepID=UPI00403ED921